MYIRRGDALRLSSKSSISPPIELFGPRRFNVGLWIRFAFDTRQKLGDKLCAFLDGQSKSPLA